MKTGRKVIAAGAAVAVVAAVAAIAILWVTAGSAGLPRDTKAAQFKATTIAGKEFDLKGLRGRVVLLDFWATWCPPCRAEAPELEKLWRKYKDRGLVVAGIALNSGGDRDLREFATEHRLTYAIVNDRAGAIAGKYRIRPIPTTYIVSPEGVVHAVHVGYQPGLEKQLEREIKELLPSRAQLQKLKPLE
ncbi:MAG TPA: TlpA disulfide reductase family protein [Armatimonadota bacterium]|nr:TlpA disulfide reductase family protein [Armatimonadota bacterium]